MAYAIYHLRVVLLHAQPTQQFPNNQQALISFGVGKCGGGLAERFNRIACTVHALQHRHAASFQRLPANFDIDVFGNKSSIGQKHKKLRQLVSDSQGLVNKNFKKNL